MACPKYSMHTGHINFGPNFTSVAFCKHWRIASHGETQALCANVHTVRIVGVYQEPRHPVRRVLLAHEQSHWCRICPLMCSHCLLLCPSSRAFFRGNVSAPGIFLDPCPTGDLLGGALRGALRGRLKRSARAVQLFGRLAVVETHTLRY